MTKTIFFHNGDVKTGTSYIQNFLDVNRSKLFEEHQCLYPNFNDKNLHKGRCHNHTSWSFSIDKDPEKLSRDISKLLDFVQKYNITKVILSNEAWFLQDSIIKIFNKIIDLESDIQLKTISYLRRIDFWSESAWKQWGLKQYDSFEEFYNLGLVQDRFEGIFNFLTKCSQIIGQKNIIVRPYEKLQLLEGLRNDFVKSIDIEYRIHNWNETEDKNLASNTGFNRDVLEVLHYCQHLFSNVHDNHLFDLFSTLLSEEFHKKPFEDYALLSPQMRYEIINRNLPYEKQIAEKFMGRQGEGIFFDPLPDINEPWQPYEGLNLKKFVPIIVNMLDENNKSILDLKNKCERNAVIMSELKANSQKHSKNSIFQKIRDLLS